MLYCVATAGWLAMGISGHWRGLGAALGVAVSAGFLLLGGSSPAQAIPCSCPAGYTVNNASPLHPFCFSASPPPGEPNQLACGGTYLPGTYGNKLLTELGFTPTPANFRRVVDATGLSNEEEEFAHFTEEGMQPIEDTDPKTGRLTTYPFTSGYTPTPGNPVPLHLGMQVSPSSTNAFDAYGVGGASVTRGSGYGVTDSAGLLAPGTTAPSFRDASGNGGITGSYAVAGLPVNQRLSFSGFFDYQRQDITVGALAGLAAGNAGSGRTDNYTFGGAFRYDIGATYLSGAAAYNFGHGSETLNVDGSTGSFNTSGYATDLRLGHIFVLLNTISSGSTGNSGMPRKAPPKPTGGYGLGLDLSGHIGYSNQQLDGFTDTSGFVFGTDQTRFGDVGGSARLFAIMPNNGYVWMPYVSGTVDQQFGFSSTLNIPNQAAIVGGDVLSLQEAQTFWGTTLGVDVRGPNGWTVGAKGFYQASADTNFTGGTAYVKIPLNYTPRPAFATRY
jgi:hypothetical protein